MYEEERITVSIKLGDRLSVTAKSGDVELDDSGELTTELIAQLLSALNGIAGCVPRMSYVLAAVVQSFTCLPVGSLAVSDAESRLFAAANNVVLAWNKFDAEALRENTRERMGDDA